MAPVRTVIALAALLGSIQMIHPSPSLAGEEARAAIHFADLGGVENWKADGSTAILIEGRNHRWYRATFFGPCPSLRFASTIGFVTEPSGDLDRFSSILVDGERCWFKTFDRVADRESTPEDGA